MRGIETREHRKAIAERREARATYAAEHAPAPASHAMRLVPGPAIVAAMTPVREQQRIEHLVLGRKRPTAEVIVGMRGTGKRRRPKMAMMPVTLEPTIEERVALREKWECKRHATPETLEQADQAEHREGSLARLWRSGAISDMQLDAAAAIAAISATIGRDVHIGTASWETRIDRGQRGDGHFYEALARVWGEVAYTRWREALGAGRAAILDIVTAGQIGLVEAAARHRISHRRLRRLLVEALDRWFTIHGQVRLEIDEATLLAAHAGILA